jgi:hypothetical protein
LKIPWAEITIPLVGSSHQVRLMPAEAFVSNELRWGGGTLGKTFCISVGTTQQTVQILGAGEAMCLPRSLTGVAQEQGWPKCCRCWPLLLQLSTVWGAGLRACHVEVRDEGCRGCGEQSQAGRALVELEV